MDSKELKELLRQSGWRFGSQITDSVNVANWSAWRSDRLSARRCICNHKPPSFSIEPFEFEMHGELHGSVTFRLCGELPMGQWVDFRIYSVPITETMQQIPAAQAVLDAAWVAAWDASKPFDLAAT